MGLGGTGAWDNKAVVALSHLAKGLGEQGIVVGQEMQGQEGWWQREPKALPGWPSPVRDLLAGSGFLPLPTMWGSCLWLLAPFLLQ